MRYHSIILSLRYQVPFCAVIYDYKTKWLLEELGLTHLIGGSCGIGNHEHLGIDLDLNTDALAAQIKALLEAHEEVKEDLDTAYRRIALNMRVYERIDEVM